MIYRVPWYMQDNRLGRWLLRHGHKRPQRLHNKIIWTAGVIQGRWVTKRSIFGHRHG